MFPIKDENPTLRTPVVTVALIALNVMAWILIQGAGTEPSLQQSVFNLGVVPGHLLGNLRAGASIRLGRDMYCERLSRPCE